MNDTKPIYKIRLIISEGYMDENGAYMPDPFADDKSQLVDFIVVKSAPRELIKNLVNQASDKLLEAVAHD